MAKTVNVALRMFGQKDNFFAHLEVLSQFCSSCVLRQAPNKELVCARPEHKFLISGFL